MFGGPAWIIARSEWRLHWRALVVIGLIAWLGASVSFAALAASRRAGSSFDRMLEATGTANAEGFIEGPVDAATFAKLADIPGVEGGAAGSMFIVGPAGTELVAGGNVIGVSLRHAFGNSLNALVREGRRLDQSRVGEIVVNEAFRDATGLGAGARIDLVSYTLEQVEQAEQTGEVPDVPGGPTVPVTIAGVGRGAEDVSDVSDPLIVVSAAFADRYEDEIGNLSTIVLLRVDPDRFDAVQAATEELFPGGIGLERAEDFGARVREGLGVQRIALLVFAGAAAAAGLLAAGQNLRRFVALTANRRETLLALGASRRMDASATAAVLAPVAVGVALGAAATSMVIAPLMITGLARQAEPHPGLWADPMVLLPGVLVLFAAFACLALLSSLAAARRHASDEPPIADGVARRLRLGAGASTGVRFALDSGRGVGGVPTRSAIVGAAVGVAGVVATLTFSASIARLLERPQDWGAAFDVVVEAPEDVGEAEDLARRVGQVDGVAATALNVYAQTDEVSSTIENGDRRVAQEFEALLPMRGSIPFTVIDGRPPLRQNEIMVGERVLELLDVEIGDRVVADWGDTRVDRTIVGTVIAPGIDELDLGAYMTPEGLRDLSDDIRGAQVAVAAADGVSAAELEERLAAMELDVRPVAAPSSIDNLDELGSLPSFLVGFLAVLSVIAGVSAMILTIRRRRGEIAVLRSLGFVRARSPEPS